VTSPRLIPLASFASFDVGFRCAKASLKRSFARRLSTSISSSVNGPRYKNLSLVCTKTGERGEPFLVKELLPSGPPGRQSQGDDPLDNSVDQPEQTQPGLLPQWSGHSCTLGPRLASPPAPNAVPSFRWPLSKAYTAASAIRAATSCAEERRNHLTIERPQKTPARGTNHGASGTTPN
jgi:hypothetical protein